MKDNKTRNQSLYEYLESLQLEFIQAELRRKIYTRPKDKKFQEKLLERKKIKIVDISERNNLPNIFTTTAEYERFYNRIHNVDGYPNFIYANQEQRDEFEMRDFINYYSINSEVRVTEEDQEVRIGTILGTPENGMVKVQVRGEDEPRLIKGEYLVRIL